MTVVDLNALGLALTPMTGGAVRFTIRYKKAVMEVSISP